MLRVKVVGRREEPQQRQVPQTAPGLPPVMEWVTSAGLVVVAVGADGKELASPTAPMGPGTGVTVFIPAPALADVAEYETGKVYELREVL